jgi:hypothetical protein
VTSTVVERFGSLSATGMATEPGFGQATLPTTTLPMTGNALELDPGLFSPQVMMGQRDMNIFPLYGEYKCAGSVTGPLFATNGALAIPAAIGPDSSAGNGVTGSSPSNSTTLSAAITTVGATSFGITSATGYAVGSYIQIDVNNTTGPTTAEVRKITALSGTTVTVDVALKYTHANAAPISKVVGPFTHTVVQANQLGSLTVEKEIGDYESLQFTGSRVNKFGVSVSAGNTEATVNIDLMAQAANILDTPSTPNVLSESPFVYAETTLSAFGQNILQATSADMEIENGLKDTFTLNQSHNLQFLTPLTRLVTCKTDVVFTSLDDPTWGYWSQMVAGQEGPLNLTFAHPSNGGSVTFNCPRARIKTNSDALKMSDVVLTTLEFDAFLSLTSLTTISATIVSPTQYLPF